MGNPLRRTVNSDLARSNSVVGIRSTKLEFLPVAAGSALRRTVSGGVVRATSGTGGPVCAPEPNAAEPADAPPGIGSGDLTDRPRGGRTLAVANRFAVAGTTSEKDRRRVGEPGPPIGGPPGEVVVSNRAATDAVTGRAAVPDVDGAGPAALLCDPAGARLADSGVGAAAAALAGDPRDGVVSRDGGRAPSDGDRPFGRSPDAAGDVPWGMRCTASDSLGRTVASRRGRTARNRVGRGALRHWDEPAAGSVGSGDHWPALPGPGSVPARRRENGPPAPLTRPTPPSARGELAADAGRSDDRAPAPGPAGWVAAALGDRRRWMLRAARSAAPAAPTPADATAAADAGPGRT